MQRQLGDRITQKVVMSLHELLVEMLHREVRILVAEQTQHPFQLLPRRPLRRGAVEPTILEPFCPILLIPFCPALKCPNAHPKHRGSLLLRDLALALLLQKPLKTHLTDSLVNSRRSPFQGLPWTRHFTSYKHTSDHELPTVRHSPLPQ